MIDPLLRQRVSHLDIQSIESMSPEPALPIDAVTLRTHCRALTTDDAMLEIYQRAAIQWLENDMQKTIVARPHTWVIGDFSRTSPFEILLPRGKTQFVDRIDYVSSGSTLSLYGPSSELSPTAADFNEDLTGDAGGVLTPLDTWPTPDLDASAPVAIHFTAGFNEGEVPFDIQESIMFAVSTLFEHRGAADLIVGGTINPKVFEVMSLLTQVRREHPFA